MNNLVWFLVARLDYNEVSIHTFFFKLIFCVFSQEKFLKWILLVNHDLLLFGLFCYRLRFFRLLSAVFPFLAFNDHSICVLNTKFLFFLAVFIYHYIHRLTLSSCLFFRCEIYSSLVLFCDPQVLVHLLLDVSLDEIINNFEVLNNCLEIIFFFVILDNSHWWWSLPHFFVAFTQCLSEFVSSKA